MQIRIARMKACACLFILIIFYSCQSDIPIDQLPVYGNSVFTLNVKQLYTLRDAKSSWAPLSSDLEVLEAIFRVWKRQHLVIKEEISYMVEQEEEARLFLLESEQKVNRQWISFIPENVIDSHRIDETYFWHYPISNDLTYYFFLKDNYVFMSNDRRFLERTYVIGERQEGRISEALQAQGLIRNKDSNMIELIIEPKYQALPEDQMTYIEMNIQNSRITGKGQESLLQSSFEQKVARQKAIDWSDMVAIIPDRVNYVDAISLSAESSFISSKESSSFSFWNSSTLDALGKQAAYVGSQYELSKGFGALFVVFQLDQPRQLEEAINEIGERQGILYEEEYQTYRIQQLVNEQLVSSIWGKKYPEIRNPFLLIIGNYLIVGNQLESMRLWIDYFLSNRTLINDEAWQKDMANLHTLSNRLVIWRSLEIDKIPFGQWLWWYHFLKDFENGSISWGPGVNQWTFKYNFGSSIEKATLAQIRWNKQYDKELIAGPFLLKAASEATILVQTFDKTIHAIDLQGNSRWDLLTTDTLKQVELIPWNEKEQRIILTDKEHLYFLRQDGTLEQQWLFEAPLTGYFEAVSFGDLGDPHIFLPTKNATIYAYNSYKEPYTIWDPFPSGLVDGKIQHWATSQQDYFLWENGIGEISLVDREGQVSKKWGRGYFQGWEVVDNKFYTFKKDIGLREWEDPKVYNLLNMDGDEQLFYCDEEIVAIANKNAVQIRSGQSNEEIKSINLDKPVKADQLLVWQAGQRYFIALQNSRQGQIFLFDENGQSLFDSPIPTDQAIGYSLNEKAVLINIFGSQLRMYSLN